LGGLDKLFVFVKINLGFGYEKGKKYFKQRKRLTYSGTFEFAGAAS